MDWFRSYIGTATDTKFRVVAKRSGARLGDILAVWQMLLERACGADERGNVVGFDFEGAEALLDLDEGQAQAIYAAMETKDLIHQGRITNWDKRQPKREREDDSTERVRACRERKKQASNTTCDNVTPCNATQHQETPRGEESREEGNLDNTTPPPPMAPVAPEAPEQPQPKRLPDGIEPYSLEFLEFWESYPNQEAQDDAWIEWLTLKKARKLPGLAILQAAICIQAESERWQDPKFIPSPGAWLRKGRWKDKPPKATPRASPSRPRTFREADMQRRDRRAEELNQRLFGGGLQDETAIDHGARAGRADSAQLPVGSESALDGLGNRHGGRDSPG